MRAPPFDPTVIAATVRFFLARDFRYVAALDAFALLMAQLPENGHIAGLLRHQRYITNAAPKG